MVLVFLRAICKQVPARKVLHTVDELVVAGRPRGDTAAIDRALTGEVHFA